MTREKSTLFGYKELERVFSQRYRETQSMILSLELISKAKREFLQQNYVL